jgi:transposase
MAMGTSRQETQETLWIPAASVVRSPSHPFYQQLNAILDKHGFDRHVEGLCQGFYSETMGRPSVAPGVYFRLLLIGYFEGIDGERGIAWRAADSLSLRAFLRISLEDVTPDHSTISRTRRLIDVETHQAVFEWVLRVLAEEGLLKGRTVAIDGTTLEANAALRSLVRRDTGEKYQEYLKRLAAESGIATPTREQLAKLDRKRPKKGSNREWKNPHDPDARITKMKDGRTHLAHKAEHAVDLETGAVVAVTLQGADQGDTTTVVETLAQAGERISAVAAETNNETVGERVKATGPTELVLDKGYHSGATLQSLQGVAVRSYCSEPDRGRRHWDGKQDEQRAVYANRRRIRGERGKCLLRQRGEKVERSFAHAYDTGGMRRTHLRRQDNIIKRLLIHVGAFNLSLILRQTLGIGKPRRLQDSASAVLLHIHLSYGDSPGFWLIISAIGVDAECNIWRSGDACSSTSFSTSLHGCRERKSSSATGC